MRDLVVHLGGVGRLHGLAIYRERKVQILWVWDLVARRDGRSNWTEAVKALVLG